jgi:threonine dehydrogenase-like Zn-dependent dehydrogenase
MMMMALQARCAAHVTMVDLEESRLERAMSLGADAVVDGRQAPLASVDRFGLVVDCTGVPAVAGRLNDHAADGATLLFFGVCPPGMLATFSPHEVFRRELMLVGSHSLSGNLPDALAIIERLGERADRLVSHRLTLDGILDQLRWPTKAGSMKMHYGADA